MTGTATSPDKGNGRRRQVVVITGGSAGAGRAAARAFAHKGYHVALLARGRERLEPGAARGRGRRRAVPGHPHRRGRCRRGRRRRHPGRGDARPHRRVGEQRHDVGVRARAGAGGRRGAPGGRGQLPGQRPRHPRRPRPDAASRPGDDRPGRLGPGLPGHPAPGQLLRLEVRHPGLRRLPAVRAAPRQERRADHVGPHAGPEHAPVRLGPQPPAVPSPTRAAHLPARGGGAGHRVGRRPSPPRILDRLPDRRRHRGQLGDPRSPRPLPGPHQLPGPADRQARAPGPARQPPGARRWLPGRPRHLRRHVEGPELPEPAQHAPPGGRGAVSGAGLALLAVRRRR